MGSGLGPSLRKAPASEGTVAPCARSPCLGSAWHFRSRPLAAALRPRAPAPPAPIRARLRPARYAHPWPAPRPWLGSCSVPERHGAGGPAADSWHPGRWSGWAPEASRPGSGAVRETGTRRSGGYEAGRKRRPPGWRSGSAGSAPASPAARG
jgi:hypothetical protein